MIIEMMSMIIVNAIAIEAGNHTCSIGQFPMTTKEMKKELKAFQYVYDNRPGKFIK